MVDKTINDLAARSSIVAGDVFEIDNTDSTAATEKVTFTQIGGLAHAAEHTTDAGVTGLVGTLHLVSLANFTADKDFALPAIAAVGDRVGLHITGTHASHELLIKSGGSPDEINGTDHSSTEWSRVWQLGETVIFRCITANANWMVETDARIPCTARQDDSTGTAISTTFISGTLTTQFDPAGICDDTNDKFVVRRAGKYKIGMNHLTEATIDDGGYSASNWVTDPDGTPVGFSTVRNYASVANQKVGMINNLTIDMAAGDDIACLFQVWNTAGNYTTGTGEGPRIKLTIEEVLPHG